MTYQTDAIVENPLTTFSQFLGDIDASPKSYVISNYRFMDLVLNSKVRDYFNPEVEHTYDGLTDLTLDPSKQDYIKQVANHLVINKSNYKGDTLVGQVFGVDLYIRT